MATTLKRYACVSCGHSARKWLGRCPACGEWATLREEAAPETRRRSVSAPPAATPFSELGGAEGERRTSGIPELDRVLGGGVVDGAVTLLAGEPGIGKSTLLLQAAAALAGSLGTVLYASAEESGAQLRLRGDRVGAGGDRLLVVTETDVDRLLETVRTTVPSVLMVDSVQAIRTSELDSPAGSVAQVRECASRLVGYAKERGIPVWIVGHVTKDGAIAGPRTLEHVVDTVVHFEGDRHRFQRVVRAVKNRFGPADEVGVFVMTERGLEAVANPSEMFLSERPERAPGSAVLPAIEGTRPFLVEVQALVGERIQGTPRRTAIGIDPQRLALILAILQRHSDLRLADRDVFVNVTGGLAVKETGADLAVAAAVASSLAGVALPDRTVHLGELGLAGEVRSVGRLDVRLREAARQGFRRAIVPASAQPFECGVELLAASRWTDALRQSFADDPSSSTRERTTPWNTG